MPVKDLLTSLETWHRFAFGAEGSILRGAHDEYEICFRIAEHKLLRDRRKTLIRKKWQSALLHYAGCGLIINTSFNVRGEPIVRSPEDAYRCFMFTGIDALVIGSYV